MFLGLWHSGNAPTSKAIQYNASMQCTKYSGSICLSKQKHMFGLQIMCVIEASMGHVHCNQIWDTSLAN
jgi:hypothetical protein